MPELRGTRLLKEWCERNGVTSAELARRVNDAARKVRRVEPKKRPPYRSAALWLEGLWRPQYHWRDCIEAVTDGYVKPADFDTWEVSE